VERRPEHGLDFIAAAATATATAAAADGWTLVAEPNGFRCAVHESARLLSVDVLHDESDAQAALPGS
jgi:hypothetical protein